MAAAPEAADSGETLRVRWAAERTLLAWVRTSLGLFGLGFVLARIDLGVGLAGSRAPFLSTHSTALTSMGLGIALVGLGAFATAAAALRYRGILIDTSPSGRLPDGSMVSFVTSAFVSLLGLLLALSLVGTFASVASG